MTTVNLPKLANELQAVLDMPELRDDERETITEAIGVLLMRAPIEGDMGY